MGTTRKPCPSCPWRVGQHADRIPGFDLTLAEGLVRTTATELGAPVFACHQSRPDAEVLCVGWLVRYGWDSIAIRLMLHNGRITPDELEVSDDWPECHETFEQVIAKLRADCA